MQRIRGIATITLLIVSSAFIVLLGFRLNRLAIQAELTLLNIKDTSKNLSDSSSKISLYLDKQTELLSTDYNQKLLQSNLAIGANINSVVRSINTQTLPPIKQATLALERFIVNTDASMNGPNGTFVAANSLLNNLALTAAVTGKSVEQVSNAMLDTAKQLNMTIEEVRAIVATPEWKSAIVEFDKALKQGTIILTNTAHITGKAAEAANYLPDLAKDIGSIAHGAATWQKVLKVFGVVIAGLGIFF